MNQPIKKQLLIAGYIAIAASIIGVIADILLLYNPNGGYETGNYLFLSEISLNRLWLGSILGVLFIPFEIAGLYVMYILLKERFPKWSLFLLLLGIYMPMIGVVVHVLFGAVGNMIHLQNMPEIPRDIISQYIFSIRLYLEPFSALVVSCHIFASIVFAILIYKQNYIIPRWMAYCNPLTLYLIFTGSYFIVPEIGTILFPAGFNLSYGIYFILVTYYVKKRY